MTIGIKQSNPMKPFLKRFAVTLSAAALSVSWAHAQQSGPNSDSVSSLSSKTSIQTLSALNTASMPTSSAQNALNCGSLALAQLLEQRGLVQAAAKVRTQVPDNQQGYQLDQLSALAQRYQVALTATELSLADLNQIALPAILLIENSDISAGHYLILEAVNGEQLTLQDPQFNRQYQQSRSDLGLIWQGTALVLASSDQVPGRHLSLQEQSERFGAGGCCRNPKPAEGPGEAPPPEPGDEPEGDEPDEPEDPCKNPRGAPVWSVNPVTMNLHVKDIPLWYQPAYGPKIAFKLSYNTQSDVNAQTAFGRKWTLNYASYLESTPSRIQILMPDGGYVHFEVRTKKGKTTYRAPIGSVYQLIPLDNGGFTLAFGNGTQYTYALKQSSSNRIFLTQITNKYGHAIKIHHDEQQRVVRVEDAQGKITTLAYNDRHLLETITGPFGRSAQFEYSADQHLEKLTDMGGFVTDIAYGAQDFIRKIRDAKGSYHFQIETPGGYTHILYTQPGSGLMMQNYRITITNPKGDKEEYFYDAQRGNTTSYTAPNQYIEWKDDRTNNGRHDNKTFYIFQRGGNGNGLITQIMHPDKVLEKRGFPAGSRLGNHIQLPGLGKTQFARNPKGYISEVTHPDGQKVRYEFAANGRDVTAKHTAFGITRYQYNAFSDIEEITDPKGNKTLYGYNSYGQLERVTYPSGAVVEYQYNAQQQLVAETLQGKVQRAFTYDAFGRVKTKTNAQSETYTYAYNGINSVTKLTYPDGQVSSWEYGQCPRLVDAKTGRGGRSKTYEYDANKWLTKVTRQNGETVQYRRDKNGNLIKLIDEMGNETQWQFDAADKKTKKIYADGSEVSYGFDARQRFKSATDARGVSTTLTRGDALGRVTQVSYSDGTPTVNYRYNSKGLIDQIQDGIGTHNFTFDEYGRVKTYDGPWENDTQTFHYNLLGQLERLEVEGSDAQSFLYDGLGRLTHIKQGARTFEYQYQDQRSSVAKLIYPNGITRINTPGAMGKLDQVAYKVGATTLAGTQFEYNNRDLISQEDITQAVELDYQVEPKQVGEYSNNLNQLTQSVIKDLEGNTLKTLDYQYDQAGNQTQGYTKDGHRFTATYDALSQVKTLEWEQNGKRHKKTFRYFYNRFLAEIKYEVDGQLKNTTRFVRRGLLPLQERDHNNQITRHFVWGKHQGGGIGGLLSITESGQDYYYLYDGKGHVTTVLDKDRNVKAAYDYSPYGVLIGSAGDPTFKQPYQYSTKRTDAETGIIYFGYRFYLPNEGRWLNRDPIEEMGGLNLYQYVGGDPVNYRDPYGLVVQVVAGALIREAAKSIAKSSAKSSAKEAAKAGARGGAIAGAAGMGPMAKNDDSPDAKPKEPSSPSDSDSDDENCSDEPPEEPECAPNDILCQLEKGMGAGQSSGEGAGDEAEKKGLPKNPDDLLKDGYTETSHPEAAKRGHRTFENSDTGDKVRFDEGKSGANGYEGQDHYHRYNPETTGKQDQYLDRNNNPCPRGCDASHLLPGD